MDTMVSHVNAIIKSLNGNFIPGHGDGWINLVMVGKAFVQEKIDYGKSRNCKLRAFLDNDDFGLEFYDDFSKSPKVSYVRIRKEQTSITAEENVLIISDTKPKAVRVRKAQTRTSDEESDKLLKSKTATMCLENWAYLYDINDFLQKLSDMAIPEDWNFKNNLPKYPSHPILWSYLRQTFIRLQNQKKIFYSITGKYAAFNTGLVDQRYMPIIALFKKNNPKMESPWIFFDFVFPGEGNGKIINKIFEEEIVPATYTETTADLFYDTNRGMPQLDYNHIIISRIHRIPSKLIEMNKPINFEIRDTTAMDKEEKGRYFKELGEAIENDTVCYRQLINRFDSAISLAIKKIRWSPRTAVPMYYSRKDKMCLLVPLCMVDDRIEDLALVVSKSPANKYEGATIIPLDWAYADARVVSQPCSNWLGTSVINGSESIQPLNKPNNR